MNAMWGKNIATKRCKWITVTEHKETQMSKVTIQEVTLPS